jgi:uncharacterized protein DUF397
MNPGEGSSLPWRKSARCGANAGCVETVRLPSDHIGVRDSKDVTTSPVLSFAPRAWTSFVQGVREGKFDLG